MVSQTARPNQIVSIQCGMQIDRRYIADSQGSFGAHVRCVIGVKYLRALISVVYMMFLVVLTENLSSCVCPKKVARV